jgi:hypothetical protein
MVISEVREVDSIHVLHCSCTKLEPRIRKASTTTTTDRPQRGVKMCYPNIIELLEILCREK